MVSKTKALILALVALFSLATPVSASVNQPTLPKVATAAVTSAQTAPTVVTASSKTTYITTASGAKRYAYKAISSWRTYAAWHKTAKKQYGCLVNLWNKESHWNRHAGHTGGAYGIPQSLPGKKMAANGRDWRNNAATQVRWGLHYIKMRYHTICRAWVHWQDHNWY